MELKMIADITLDERFSSNTRIKSLKIEDLRKIMCENINKLDQKRFVKGIVPPALKSAEQSREFMAEGMDLYRQKDLNFAQLVSVMSLFNSSVAYAPKDSKEMITAYANKSAVLQRMRKYAECAAEIEKALQITESIPLKIKLLCRKVECLTALGSTDNRRVLEKAKFLVLKLEGPETEKSALNKLMKKTQLVVNEGKLEVPKEEKRKIHALKMIEEVEKRDLSESVRVEYSEIYGRHLVAARDYEPGEIISVEKPYFNFLESRDQYCGHCFAHLWTAVPCDYCPRQLYCSEKCKADAWSEYHEMDCRALSGAALLLNGLEWNEEIEFVMSVFCKALKEAGSIEKLLADIESLSQSKDKNSNSELLSMNFTDYKSIFTMPVGTIERKIFKRCISDSLAALICLAGYSKVLGKPYNTRELERLVKDDKAMLVGALLLKFAVTFSGGCPLVILRDPRELLDKEGDNFGLPDDKVIPLLTMHTVSGCVPNVDSFPAHGNRFVTCAIQPVKAGDQLIAKLKSVSIWDQSPKSARQLKHMEMYGCPCECQACTEDWFITYDRREKLGELVPKVLALWDERESILLEWKRNCHKPSYPDIKILSRTIELVREASQYFCMPSMILVGSVMLFRKVVRAFYDPSEVYTRVQSLREQNLEQFPHVLQMTKFSLERL